MKFISTLLFTILVSAANSQVWKLSTHYSLGVPQQQMEKNIQAVHSLQVGILYQLKHIKQLSAGIDFGIGSYASKRIEQTFQFDNNTAAIVPVNYNSNAFNVALQGRLNLLNEKYCIVPYINAKGGLYNFFSTIYIEDPTEAGGCHALEQKTIMNDKTPYWSAGGGLQIDPVIFSKTGRKGNIIIDISANTIHGGTMDYINTKHLTDAQTVNDPDAKAVQVRFINASTQAIHEHTVAQVFTSSLRLLEFRAGVIMKLGKCN
ncbi:MAG: hypothetical protein ACHQFX_05180 [Chitinophagales bacterium]